MEWVGKKVIKLEREQSELDKLLLKFVSILQKYVNYVVVSGYVSILFGRARSTEDIDVIIDDVEKSKVESLFSDLIKKRFWCINATKSEAYETLKSRISLRFAKKKQVIPNLELKFAKNFIDKLTLKNAITVLIKGRKIKISPIEMQIIYKENVLGSKKDLEDAFYLRELFKDRLNKKLMNEYEKLVKKWKDRNF